MFYDSELRFLEKMLHKCHLHTASIDPIAPLDGQMDQEWQQLLQKPSPDLSFYDIVSDVRPATIYRLQDIFGCRYIFFALPFCETATIFITGPYLNHPVSKQQILELAEKIAVPPSQLQQLELFYSAIPVMQEENHLFAMINTFAEFIFSGENNFENVDMQFDNGFGLSPQHRIELKNATDAEGLDIQIMENRYQFENQLIDAVAQGNSHKAELMMTSFSNMMFENRVADPLRNAKNYCIIMNTLMRKAAEKGRVHPVHLNRISSDFAHRIEALRSLNDVKPFMLEIMQTYCRLVKRNSMKNYSSLIQKIMILVENDLTGDLSLQTVAKRNNVSAGYLSGLFKKETGDTFTKYVNNRRIALAKHLLKTSNLQVQTIAQHCGILDFHYFCRVFKNSVGKTPTEYRSGFSVD